MQTKLKDPPEHLQITYLSGAFDKTSPSEPTSWEDLCTSFCEHHRAHDNFAKLEHRAFSPSSRLDGSRLLAQNVQFIHWAVWDLDDVSPEILAEVRSYLIQKGVAHVTHTTASHGKGGKGVGRWRVICPLTSPVPSGLWKTVWTGINKASGGHNDPACKDPSRLYFLPGWDPQSTDPGDRFIHVHGGYALDPKPFLQSAAPLDLAQITADPVGQLELQAVCNKLSNARDPAKHQIAERLRAAIAGHNYGNPTGDPSLDLWRFRFAQAIMGALPQGDIDQITSAFRAAHVAIDPDPQEVDRRQEEFRAKLARFQLKSLKMPEILAENFGGDVIEGDSDLELARWVVGSWGSVVHSRGCFWRYDRDLGVWDARPEDAVWKSLETLDGSLVTTKKALFRLSERQGTAVSRASRLHTLDEKFFDRSTPGICFRNGFLDIADRSLDLREHSPKNRATFAVDADWNPGALCPAWDTILDDVFRGDEDKSTKIQLLQEFAGAALGGVATQYAKALILLGGGSNGKSTILQVIGGLFPDAVKMAQTPHDWVSQSAAYNLVSLSRASINLAPEVSDKTVGRAEVIKAVVAGDPITARPIREMPFSFQPRTAHFFAMNELFQSRDNSEGFWRRFLILKFNRNFAQDATTTRTVESLVAEVLEQKAGVYAWALRGLQRLIDQGHYTHPDSSRQELTTWQEDCDPVAEWLLGWEPIETTDVVQSNLPTAKMLHDAFVSWATENRIPEYQIPRRTKFARRLTNVCKVYRPGGMNHFALRLRGFGGQT